jgi:hypothetical protein
MSSPDAGGPDTNSPEANSGVSRDLLNALDAAAVSSSRKLAERGGSPAFRLVREIGPKLQPPLVQPLLIANGTDDGWLVLEQTAADRIRLRWLAADGLSSRVAAELHRGSGDTEVEAPAAVAVDRDGNVCLLDSASGSIRRFSHDGRWLETIVPLDADGNPPMGAQDLALDSQRHFWYPQPRLVQWSHRWSDSDDQRREPTATRSVCSTAPDSAAVADTSNNRLVESDQRRPGDCRERSTVEFPSRVRANHDGKSVVVLDRRAPACSVHNRQADGHYRHALRRRISRK